MKCTTTAAVFAAALSWFGQPAAALTLFSASGDVAAITPTVDGFRAALGALNPFTPENFVGGRRQINWDAAPDAISDPNPFPGEFFNFPAAPRARGIEFSATGDSTGFLLSSTAASGQPPAFGFAGAFPVFSEERLFSPVGGTTFDVLFFDPANPAAPATTTGLGVVFTGLDEDDTVTLSFFDAEGELLTQASPTAPAADPGLSFVGVLFDDPVVASVGIAGGGRFLAENGDFAGPDGDAFVMDDFIFGEPTPGAAEIPLPGAAWLLLAGLGALGAARRRA